MNLVKRFSVPTILFIWISARVLAQCEFDWHPGQAYPGVQGIVTALTIWNPDGLGPANDVLVAAGDISPYVGDAPNRVGYWDGCEWHNLGNLTSGIFAGLATVGNDLFIGGRNIRNSGSTTNIGVGRWNGVSWSSLGLVAGSNGILALHGSGSELIVGGDFISIGGIPASHIARWDGVSWHALGNGPGGWVYAIGDYGQDLVCAWLCPGPGWCVSRWDGLTWQQMGASLNNVVYALYEFNGELHAGGKFQFANFGGLAKWDGQQWISVTTMTSQTVRAFQSFGSELVVAGESAGFPIMDPSFPFAEDIASWNGTEWSRLGTERVTLQGDVQALAVYREELIVAGQFNGGEIGAAFNVARWDGANWNRLGDGLVSAPSSALGVGIAAPIVDDDDLWISGPYYSPFGQQGEPVIWSGSLWTRPMPNPPAGNVVAIHQDKPVLLTRPTPGQLVLFHLIGGAWHQLGSSLNAERLYAASYDGFLVVAGYSSVNGVASPFAARWNGVNWEPMDAGLSILVSTLKVIDSELLASGFGAVLRWDGNQWIQLGSTQLPGAVVALEKYSGKLMAALWANDPAKSIFQWDGSTWTSIPGSPGTKINALAVFNGELIAGGYFSHVGGATAGSIARWNGSNWQTLRTGLSLSSPQLLAEVYTLTSFRGELIVLGNIEFAGTVQSSLWARWGRTGILGDIDASTQVGLTDLAMWQDCMVDPLSTDAAAGASSECLCFYNSDGDADIDLRDWAALQLVFGQ